MPESQTSASAAQIHPLARAFFARGPRRVARELLGKVLVRDAGPNRRTARTSVLFGPPGHAYVYFIYGNHYCLNVSCEPAGKAGGVLFRALEPLSGVDEMARDRGIEIHDPKSHGLKDLGLKDLGLKDFGLNNKDLTKLTSGPGRLCEAFAITRARDNGCDLTSRASGLWIGDDGYRARSIRTTPRIGISKAIDRPLRYLLDGNPFVSKKTSPRSQALDPL